MGFLSRLWNRTVYGDTYYQIDGMKRDRWRNGTMVSIPLDQAVWKQAHKNLKKSKEQFDIFDVQIEYDRLMEKKGLGVR
jgi:hypothetical protein